MGKMQTASRENPKISLACGAGNREKGGDEILLSVVAELCLGVGEKGSGLSHSSASSVVSGFEHLNSPKPGGKTQVSPCPSQGIISTPYLSSLSVTSTKHSWSHTFPGKIVD